MTLTRTYRYSDNGYDDLTISESAQNDEDVYICGAEDGLYVTPANSVPLAVNVLGHDLDEEDRHADSVSVEDAVVSVAQTPMTRDFQLRQAAALLKAVIAYDKRAIRLATAEKRREAAAQALTDAVIRLRNDGPGAFTGDEIGKLREALGRYDASLAN